MLCTRDYYVVSGPVLAEGVSFSGEWRAKIVGRHRTPAVAGRQRNNTEQIFVQEMFGCKWLIQDQSTITDSKLPLLCPHIFVNANGRRTTQSRSRDWDKRTTRFKNKFYTS